MSTKKKIKTNPKNKKESSKIKNTKSVKKISKDKEKLNAISKELENVKDIHVRLKAEFDNFRRRKVNEISTILQYEGESVIKGFIPIIDDLDRMINSTDSSENLLRDGILLVKNKIDKFLESLEVKTFAEKGEQMDTDLHDAMMTQSEKDLEDNSIIEVFEKGYTYKDKIIRHAKVIVNKK